MSIAGYGLQQGDAVAIVKGADCGASSGDLIAKGHVDREAVTKAVTGYDDTGHALTSRRISAAFQVPSERLQEGHTYNVCYAPALGLRAENAEKLELSDFFYNAGLLKVDEAAYACDFDTGSLADCGFIPFKEHYDLDFEWHVTSGPSATPGTGPQHDHTNPNSTSGFYAIMKSPGFLTDGASAIMLGPPLIVEEGSYCVSFAYNMHGDDVNSLRVYVAPVTLADQMIHDGDEEIGDGTRKNNAGDAHAWGEPQWVAVGNKGPEWHTAGFQTRIKEGEGKQLIFEALAGRSEKGDIAIDDLLVHSGECRSDARSMPKSKVGTKDMICGEVRMVTGNHPEDKAWSLSGAISCAGRGYSLAQVQHAWVPCCVPHFGTYTLLLHDRLNDGWEGSKLEMRFFDRTMTFGGEMQKRSGDVKVPVVIGQLEIHRAIYEKGAITADVTAVHPNSFVFCGVAEAGAGGQIRTPIPHKSLMKEYGVRSKHATTEKNQRLMIKIEGDFIKAGRDFDLYCYSELADSDLRRSMNETLDDNMDDAQIAATRFRITTDDTAPLLTLEELQTQSVKVIARIRSNERAKAWCYPLMMKSKDKVTSEMLKAIGHVVDFDKEDSTAAFEFQHLASDADYQLFCYAEDFAEPKKNQMDEDTLKRGGVSIDDKAVIFHTTKRAPAATITRVSSLSSGFDVFVELDAPGKVYCAAAPEGVDFPPVKDVLAAGAVATLETDDYALDPHAQVRVAIRGVKPQSPYKIFCAASTTDGSLTTLEKSMWKGSHPVISFGKFCDIPTKPATAQRDDNSTPFDPLSSEEELAVRRYILGQSKLGIESVYRVNILPNK